MLAESLPLALDGDDAREVCDELQRLSPALVLVPFRGRGADDLEVSGKEKALLRGNRAFCLR